MIDVSYSDTITNTIKKLRENIYDKEEFKNIFSNKLSDTIGADTISYYPDQFGGWSVNISTINSNIIKDSSSYVGIITDALIDSILSIDNTIYIKSIACNLVNIIVTGSNTIVIKL